nr:cytochrome c oxidase subunit I [Rhizobium sp. Q54]
MERQPFLEQEEAASTASFARLMIYGDTRHQQLASDHPRLNGWLLDEDALLLSEGTDSVTSSDAGWFSYPPLAGPEYGPGKRSDIYAQMITFTEVAALAVAVELIVTILKLRAPGMTLNRMPIFVWAR